MSAYVCSRNLNISLLGLTRIKSIKFYIILLSNAIKFSYQDGRGKIEILLKAEDQESEFQYKTLLIKIRNIGKGIATDDYLIYLIVFMKTVLNNWALKGMA